MHFHDTLHLQRIAQEQQFGIDQEEIREYFEEETTIRCLFDLFEHLFDIRITATDVPKEEVRADDDIRLTIITEELDDGSSTNSHPLGAIYLDLHPRQGKSNSF